MWLADMLKEKHGYTQAAATCEYPHSLQGRSLMSINKDDFHCGMRGFVLLCLAAFMHIWLCFFTFTTVGNGLDSQDVIYVCLTIRSVACF